MKHIKKSMFISTVLMVVMLIAALSTATFAWYTSNNTVASTATNVGSAESSSANIGIGFSSTATGTQITFDALVDPVTGKGGLYPVSPVTFYAYEGMAEGTNSNAEYLSSPIRTLNATTNNVIDADGDGDNATFYAKRIVNIATASDIKATSTFKHDVDAATPIVTNLKDEDFDGNYKKVYTTTAYAYNDTQTTAPALNYVTVTNAGQYTYYADADDTAIGESNLYKITAVYKVVEDNAQSGEVTQLNAYQNYFAGKKAPVVNTYVVAYEVWNTAEFNTTLNSNQTFKGYAATTAGTANSGDILVGDIDEDPYYLESDPVFGNDGFAYIYKIYSGTPETKEGGIKINDFSFNKAPVDASKAFKDNATTATKGELWAGYKTPDANNSDPALTYSDTNKDVAIVTGRKDTSKGETINKFYVYNRGNTAITNVNASLTVTGNIPEILRVAIFVNQKYYGTLANTDEAPTTYGRILKNAMSTDMPTYKAMDSVNLGSLAANTAFEIQLLVWFDGTGLDDTSAGNTCAFTLNFEATSAN